MKIKIQPGLDHITDRSDLLQDFVVFVCKDLRCMPCDIDIVDDLIGYLIILKIMMMEESE